MVLSVLTTQQGVVVIDDVPNVPTDGVSAIRPQCLAIGLRRQCGEQLLQLLQGQAIFPYQIAKWVSRLPCVCCYV